MGRTSFGQRLCEMRERAGLSQHQLAASARLSQAYVSMLESGERDNPSYLIMHRLASALGGEAADLLPNENGSDA